MIKIASLNFPMSLACVVLLASSIVASADDDKPKTPLAEQMTGISKDFRSLRKMVADPAQKDAALKLVKDMEDRAAKAKGFEPSKTKDIPQTDRDQFLADYHKQMDGLLADFQKLEAEVNDGKTADASALLDKLQMDKREGHKKFNAEDEKRPLAPAGHFPPASPAPAQ